MKKQQTQNRIFPVEQYVKLYARKTKSGTYKIRTVGMDKFEQPELIIEVHDRMFLSGAACIVNDIARYLAKKKQDAVDGMILELNKWTRVKLTYYRGKILLTDGFDEKNCKPNSEPNTSTNVLE